MQTTSLSIRAPLSPRHFAELGLTALAYVKPVTEDGTSRFAIHGADGRRLALVDDRATAFALIREYDLEPANLQ